MKRKFCVAIAWCLFWFLPAMVAAEGPYRTRVETGVRTQMDDGVGLVADIYRPDASGTFPCLLRRTPYNRKGTAEQAGELASYGYIVVVQDTRGRFDSEGEFYPFRHETRDGYQTVEWVAELPGSNGKVAMYGGSYVGATQMLAAIGRPPHLVAVFPNLTASEYYDGWTYQSGAFMQWFASTWTTNLSRDTLRRKIATSARPEGMVLVASPGGLSTVQVAVRPAKSLPTIEIGFCMSRRTGIGSLGRFRSTMLNSPSRGCMQAAGMTSF